MSNADLLWCGDVLHRLRCHKDAFPFQMPVDPSLKEYHKIIKKPMDLMTLGRHLHSGRYPDRIAFCEQVRLIFANCRTFNVASSEFCKMGNRLERFFDTILKKEEKKPTSTTSVDEGSFKKREVGLEEVVVGSHQQILPNNHQEQADERGRGCW